MRLADKGTLDLQEQVVFQAPLVHLDPEDLRGHRGPQEWLRKRMDLRWFQVPLDHQDNPGLRVLQEQMEFRGRLEYLE